jgi:hypothetical protein
MIIKLNSKNQTRERLVVVGRVADSTAPNGQAVRTRASPVHLVHRISKPCDSQIGVEVLSELGDYPIGSHGPGVYPIDRSPLVRSGSLDEYGGPKGLHVDRFENKGVVRCRAGQKVHHMLARRWAMEPPLQIRVEELVHRRHVTVVERLVEPEH